jgi:hypothetical protein
MNRERLMFNPPHPIPYNKTAHWFKILKEGKKRRNLQAEGNVFRS